MVAEEGYVTWNHLERDFPGVRLIGVTDTAEALEAVSLGRANAYVGNLATAGHAIERPGYRDLKVAAPTPYHQDLTRRLPPVCTASLQHRS